MASIPYAADSKALAAVRTSLKTSPVMTMAVSTPPLGVTLTVLAEVAMVPNGAFSYRLRLDKTGFVKDDLEAAFEDIRERFVKVTTGIGTRENMLGRAYGRINSLSGATNGQSAGLVTTSPQNVREAAGAVVQLNMAATALNAAATSAASLERTLPQLYELASQLGTLLVFAEPFSSGELILQYAIVKGDKVVVLGCNY